MKKSLASISLSFLTILLSLSISSHGAANSCISFGGKSISGKFEASGAIYRVKDGYKVIYDGDDPKLIGGTVATKVEIDTRVKCEGFEGKVYSSDLSVSKTSDDPKVSGSISVFFPAGSCPTQSIHIRILKPQCQFGEGCDKLVVKESVSILGNDLYWLDASDDSQGLPCQKKPTKAPSKTSRVNEKNPAISDSTLKPNVCPGEYSFINGVCVPKQISACPAGYTFKDGTCVPGAKVVK